MAWSEREGITMAAFCNHCGVKLPGDSRFCPECGAAIASAEPMAGVRGAAPIAPASALEPVTPQTEAPKAERAKILKWVVGILSGLAVIFLLTLVGLSRHDRQPPAT